MRRHPSEALVSSSSNSNKVICNVHLAGLGSLQLGKPTSSAAQAQPTG
jgi:hypothetical protein